MFGMVQGQYERPSSLSFCFQNGKQINQIQFLLFPVGSGVYIKCTFCLRKTYVSEKDQTRVGKKDSLADIPCDKDLWESRKHFSGLVSGFKNYIFRRQYRKFTCYQTISGISRIWAAVNKRNAVHNNVMHCRSQ